MLNVPEIYGVEAVLLQISETIGRRMLSVADPPEVLLWDAAL